MDFVGGGSFRIGEMGRGKAAWTRMGLGWLENGAVADWLWKKEMKSRYGGGHPAVGGIIFISSCGSGSHAQFLYFWNRGCLEDNTII